MNYSVASVPNHSCLKCWSEMIYLYDTKDEEVWMCPQCDVPTMEDCQDSITQALSLIAPDPYINICWNCHTDIDSRTCQKSSTYGMGYHCPYCGHDLTEWKRRKNMLIT